MLFGFSINTLSLFGLVLAIGIVVDDAIVVVENVERNIETGLSPREATYQAMNEVSGPIIAIALVLCAVFVPIAFISGLTGQFYRQFALTIAISTVISAFNSLTLSPALGALLLKAHDAPKDWLTRGHGPRVRLVLPPVQPRVSIAARDGYSGGVGGMRPRKAVVAGRLCWPARRRPFGLFKIVPGGFVPAQDKQYLIGFAQLPDGASLDRTEDVIRRMARDRAERCPASSTPSHFPACRSTASPISSNAGIVFVVARSRSTSARPARSAAARSAAELNKQVSARSRMRSSPMLPAAARAGLGTIGGFKLQIEDRAGAGLRRARTTPLKAFMAKAQQTPELAGVVLQLPDQRAAALRRRGPHQGQAAGRPLTDVFDTHADLSRLALRQRLQPVRPHLQVSAQADAQVPRARRGHRPAEDAQRHRRDGAAVGAAASVKPTGPERAMRYNGFPPPTSTAAPRRATRPARRRPRSTRIAAETLPHGIELRMDRADLSGDPRRQHALYHLPALRAARVPRARRAVRKPDAAAGDHPDRADVPAAAHVGVWLTAWRQQHLHADRLDRAGRPGGKNAILIVEFARELESPGRTPIAGGDRGLPPAPAADPDDVARLHHGRRAAGAPPARAPRCARRWASRCSPACSA